MYIISPAAHTIRMDGIIYALKRLQQAAVYPAVLTACAVAVLYALSLLPFAETASLAEALPMLLAPLFGTAFCASYVHACTNSVKKALAAALSYLAANGVLISTCGVPVSLLGALLFALLFGFILQRAEYKSGFLLCLLPSVLLVFAAALLADSFGDAVRQLAEGVKGKGAAFGALNYLYRIALGDGWQDLFYHKAYGGTAVLNGGIVTGAADIFAQGAQHRSAAQLLCGKYFASLFVPLGCAAALYRQTDKRTAAALMLCAALSVLTGDERLFAVLLLLLSPLLFTAAAFSVFVGYAAASFLDLRVGFARNADIFSAVTNMKHGFYFVLTGAVLAVLAGFLTRYLTLRFGIGTAPAVSPALRKLVRALGGEENILQVQNGCVTVANPNLIDILSLDCDLRQNTVFLSPDKVDLLRSLT